MRNLLACVLIAYAPVLFQGYPANGWDSRYHGAIAHLFGAQLWRGELYPRWLEAANQGLGSPHFFYYAPLGYYLAALFQPFGGVTAITQLGVASVLLGSISGLTAYLWLSRLTPTLPALAGAIFYAVAPYHLFLNLLLRADYAEFAAMAFTPLLLLGVDMVRSRRAFGPIIVALALAATILCNVVAGLIGCMLLAAYAVGRHIGRDDAWRNLAIIIAAGMLGLAVSGFYLLPAIMLQSEVHVPVVPMPPRVFIFGAPPGSKLDLFVTVMFIAYAVLLAAASCYVLRPTATAPNTARGAATVCATLAATMLILATIWARPLWLMVPMSWTMQMTYRLFIIIDLCAACMVAATVARAATRPAMQRSAFLAIAAAMLAALIGDAAAQHEGIFVYDAPLWAERMKYLPDYGLFRPRAVTSPLPADALPLYSQDSKAPGIISNIVPLAPQTVRVIAGKADIVMTRLNSRNANLRVDAALPGIAQIPLLYFRGWQGIDASGKPLAATPCPGSGMVCFAFPTGRYSVDLRLAQTLPERAGYWMSAAGLAAASLWWWLALARRGASYISRSQD